MIAITERSFAQYPALKQFLESSPPDVGLLSTDRYDRVYRNLEFTAPVPKDSLSLVQILCLYGKVSHVEALPLSPDEIKEALKADNYEAILCAAINGHLTAVQHLETHLTDYEKKAAAMTYDYRPIRNAALNGHLNLNGKCARNLEQNAEFLSEADRLFQRKRKNQHLDMMLSSEGTPIAKPILEKLIAALPLEKSGATKVASAGKAGFFKATPPSSDDMPSANASSPNMKRGG